MTYQFEREPVSGIILVYAYLNEKHKMKLALDTAASITTFDVNALCMVFYPVKNVIETGLVETANGIVEVDIIQTDVISAFGHTVRGMEVQIYDFLAHGIVSDYDGVLGLDFFKDTEFTVNMKNHTIEVKK